jgi:hypothetical protein
VPDRNFFRRSRGEDRIQMGRERDERSGGRGGLIRNHISAPVDLRFPTESQELRLHPFRAPLLEESRRRDTAHLEMLFVNPLSFPA